MQNSHDLDQGAVTQGSFYLAPFDIDAPTLTTQDGVLYVPIRWLCELLGLAPAHWIGAVCAMYRQETETQIFENFSDDPPLANAASQESIEPDKAISENTASTERIPNGPAVRRLPYTPNMPMESDAPEMIDPNSTRTRRLEWCLEWSYVIRWLSFHLNSRYVQDKRRREQLQTYRTQVYQVTSTLYERKQEEFHEVKRTLFSFLHETERMLNLLNAMDTELGPHIEQSAPTAAQGQADRTMFSALIATGRQRYQELADALNTALQEILDVPVIDAYRVDADRTVIDTVAMPLIPVIPNMDEVNHRIKVSATWREHELLPWLKSRGFIFKENTENP